MEVSIIKNDLIGELSSTKYYNEQEILRLINSNEVSHEIRIKRIAKLMMDIVSINETLKLVEIYFPNKEVASAKEVTAAATEKTV